MKPQTRKTLSRRDALKTLAAVTGVAVLASVKNEWETPLVQVGVLPAHAQASASGIFRVNNNTFAPMSVTVPFNLTLTSLETQEIGSEGTGTFTLAPGTYQAYGESLDENCIRNAYFDFTLAAGETVVWDIECEQQPE